MYVCMYVCEANQFVPFIIVGVVDVGGDRKRKKKNHIK